MCWRGEVSHGRRGKKKEDTGYYARCLPEGRKCADGAGISGRRTLPRDPDVISIQSRGPRKCARLTLSIGQPGEKTETIQPNIRDAFYFRASPPLPWNKFHGHFKAIVLSIDQYLRSASTAARSFAVAFPRDSCEVDDRSNSTAGPKRSKAS